MSGPFCLKKSSHCDSVLEQLFKDELYTDVTLTAEGQSINAHKNILSLASSYFQDVLLKDSNTRTVVIFRDMKFTELKNVVKFIYTGETILDFAELKSFMEVAQMLKIYSLFEENVDSCNKISRNSEEKYSQNNTKRMSSKIEVKPNIVSSKIKSDCDESSTDLDQREPKIAIIKEEPLMSPPEGSFDCPLTPGTSGDLPMEDEHSNSCQEENATSSEEPTFDNRMWGEDDEEPSVNGNRLSTDRREILSSFTISSLDSNGEGSDKPPNLFLPTDLDTLTNSNCFSTFSRGRIYPSPAQESLKKLILRTEVEVKRLSDKIESGGGASPDEMVEIELKRSALANYRKLLRNKINAARRSMKSREKKKLRKTIMRAPNLFSAC